MSAPKDTIPKPRAGATASPKMGSPVAPAAGAHHWTIVRLTNRTVKNPETGKQRQQSVAERLRGDPGEDGIVAEAWLVSEFKPAHILARWGEGRYRVDWYSTKNERVGSDIFEVSAAKTKGRASGSRLAPVSEEAASEASPPALDRGGMPTDPWSLMLYMQQREEASAERERIRGDQQRERDREFNAQMQAQNAANLQAMLSATTRPAAVADASGELARREMAVTMQEMSLKLEKRLAALVDNLDLGGGDDDDKDLPGSLQEAGTRIGMKLLGELEEKAPELLEEAIPRVASWLKSKGFGASDELEDELAKLRKRRGGRGGTAPAAAG